MDIKQSFMTHRESSITLIFSPITKENIRKLLKDLALIRQCVLEKEQNRLKETSNAIDVEEEYQRLDNSEVTSLSIFQKRNKDQNDEIDSTEQILTTKIIPTVAILLVISSITWFLSRKTASFSKIISICVFFLSLFFLLTMLAIFIVRYIKNKRNDNERVKF